MKFFVSRYNRGFDCLEYLTFRQGWTLHTSKAGRWPYHEAERRRHLYDGASISEARADANERLAG